MVATEDASSKQAKGNRAIDLWLPNMPEGTSNLIRASGSIVLEVVLRVVVEEHQGGEAADCHRAMPPTNHDRILNRRQRIQLRCGWYWREEETGKEEGQEVQPPPTHSYPSFMQITLGRGSSHRGLDLSSRNV
jgi:hypothetical protein